MEKESSSKHQNHNVPRLRFPGFEGEWDIKTIKEIAPLQRGFDLPTDKLQEGIYPVIYSNGIRNYHSEFKCHAPGVLTGRSGTIGKVFFVNEDYWAHNTTLWVTDFFNNSPKFIFYMYQSINIEQFSSGSGVPTLNRNDVHEYKTGVPSAQEQNKIATFLSFLDERISKQRELIEKLKTYKRGALSVMFPQKGETVPRCRFASFTGDWEKRRFSEFAQRESAFQTSSYNCPSVEYEDVITEEGRLNKNIRLKETQKTGIKFDGTQVLYGKLRPYLHNWLNPDCAPRRRADSLAGGNPVR